MSNLAFVDFKPPVFVTPVFFFRGVFPIFKASAAAHAGQGLNYFANEKVGKNPNTKPPP